MFVTKLHIKGVELLAKNLKKIRKELDLTVNEFAVKLGISPNNISSYERNLRCPSIELGIQLYEKLNVNLNWFVSGQGNMFNQPTYEEVEDKLEEKILSVMKKYGVVEK